MPSRQFTGSRIRERRLMQGLRQSDLARMAGMFALLSQPHRTQTAAESPDGLLSDIARALSVEPQSLAEGAEAAKVEALRRAARGGPRPAPSRPIPPSSTGVDEFAGRFPAGPISWSPRNGG